MRTVADDIEQRAIAYLSSDTFKAGIRAAIRGYYEGLVDQFSFFDSMLSTIERGFEQAWRQGAKECGIAPDERTPEEEAARTDQINRMVPYVQKLIGDIDASKARLAADQASKDAGDKPLWGFESDTKSHYVEVRGEIWANRYNEVLNQAKTMACQDQKLRWDLGPTEHCSSCLKVAGKVKRASQWAAADIRPQHPNLECGGHRCQCQLNPTKEPMSMGRLPSIP